MALKYIKNIDQPPEIDVVIPAAGMGRRMKSYGPKSLINIKGAETVIGNQVKIIKKIIPSANIILVCGFQAIQLMNATPSDIVKVENEKYEETNVIRSVGMGLRASKRDVLIVYGDLVFNEFALQAMNLNRSSVLVGEDIMDPSEIGCTYSPKQELEHMMYDLPVKWGQMVFLKSRELEIFKEICWNPNNYNMFGFEAINKVVASGGTFKICEHKKAKVIDIDTSKDIERLHKII